MRIILRIGGALTLMGLLGGCYNQIHYELQPMDEVAAAVCPAPAQTSSPEQIVGVALSGGGSRAAVFAAASLEALWEHGLLDLVSHVSSVSAVTEFDGKLFLGNLQGDFVSVLSLDNPALGL